MVYFKQEGNRLVVSYDSETLWIEPWGRDALRVRSTKGPAMPQEQWALLDRGGTPGRIAVTESGACVQNGKIRAEVN